MTQHIVPLRSAAETQLIESFRSGPFDTGPAAERRREAFAVFTRVGLPTRRNEAWHYTDLRAAMREALPWAPAPDAATVARVGAALGDRPSANSVRLVLIDGHFAPDASDLAALPEGVRVMSLASALAENRPGVLDRLGAIEIARGDPALALNTAFMRDGIVVEVAAGTQATAPLCLVSCRTGAVAAASAARSLVILGAGASLSLVELHEGLGGAGVQTHDAIEFVLGARASLDHVVVQRHAASAISVATVTADLGEEAAIRSFALVTGAALARRQSFVRCGGRAAKVSLSGASLLGARQHADTTLVIDHAEPAGESRERFKFIVGEEATGVYQGKVIVRPGAQKTDGGMKSNAILLSDRATMNNKPELEIFADDVVCGHGATCGALDQDQIFYLMARGISRADAEALLLEAFVNDAIEHVQDETLREMLTRLAGEWLTSRTIAGPLSAPEPVGPAERSVLGNQEPATS